MTQAVTKFLTTFSEGARRRRVVAGAVMSAMLICTVGGCRRKSSTGESAATTTAPTSSVRPTTSRSTTTTASTTTSTTSATTTVATTTTADPGYVSEAQFGAAWPLTVSEGHVRCVEGALVVFVGGGDTYALNGLARGVASKRRWREVDEIWRDDPTIEGAKVNIGPLIDRGLTLC